MRKITLTISACLLELVLMLIVFSISTVYSQAAGGTGTELDPFVIEDCDELQDMQSDLGAYYKLGNDIDCSMTSTLNGGAGFAPVGSSSNPFAGSFDGDEKKTDLARGNIILFNDMIKYLAGNIKEQFPEEYKQSMIVLMTHFEFVDPFAGTEQDRNYEFYMKLLKQGF